MSIRTLIARVPLWLREVLIMAAMGLLVFWIASSFQRDAQRSSGGEGTGEIAPSFDLVGIEEGQRWTLEGLRGKPVIMSFWATWCGVCRTELPALERFWQRVDGRYHFVTVSAESKVKLNAFARKQGLTLPIALDPRGALTERFDVSGFPTTVILDADGIIAKRFLGAVDPEILEEHMVRLGARASR